MNAVGIALVWCVLQVTLLGLLAGGLYLVARWLRPAAAAPVLLTCLGCIVLLSLAMFSPRPRWSCVRAGPASAAAEKVAATHFQDPPDAATEQESRVAGGGPWAAPLEKEGLVPPSSRPAWQGLLPRGMAEELIAPPTPDGPTAWRWPAIVGLVLLAGMAGGLAWLLLGLWAVYAQRRASRPIEDRDVAELIDVLCAELGCARPIEVRQCQNLVAAALIGWRRPTLLLGPDWATWSPEERRAVLAHEIAHARGHDCLAALCGQLALMLHCYHPLLYWLAGRLRLEQELAADAAAAGISGGQRQYLATIAGLALRQHDRPLLLPARSFLPTRTTFLRRIAMLRDNKLPVQRVSPVARLAAVGLVLAAGWLAAGLRGPAGAAPALAAAPAKTTAEKTTRLNSAAVSLPADPAKAVQAAVEKIATLAETDPQLPPLLDALKKLDQKQAVPAAAKFLDAKEDNVRRAAIYVLWRGGFGSIEPAAAGLLRACDHEEDLTRGMAALALGAHHVSQSFPRLVKMASEDRSGYARRCAVYALGLLGNKDAVPTLNKALEDPETLVRKNAQAALRLLQPGGEQVQMTEKDIQPDGTIRFTNRLTMVNESGQPLTTSRFVNSDFVKLEKIADEAGKPLKFESQHQGNIYKYRVPLDPPVPPGATYVLDCEGTETSLITPGDKPDTFRYHMQHWPGTNVPTKRIEIHRLPAGAELLGKSPEDLVELHNDGRIELRIERTIPAGGSLEVSYQYRLKPAAAGKAEPAPGDKPARTPAAKPKKTAAQSAAVLPLAFSLPAGAKALRSPRTAPGS